MRHAVLCIALLGFAGAAVSADAGSGRTAFRVCADPNNLPFSDRNHHGFENRLAALWADSLGLELEYTWFPQRMGFVRNTLKAKDENGVFKCDVVMGVAQGFDLLQTTKPYYRSTYALVYARGRGLDDVESGADFLGLDATRKSKLRIGVFDQTPGAVWLARHGLGRQMVPYPAMAGDPQAYPGQVVEQALVNAELDAVVIWGPIAGYFAKRAKSTELVVVPLESEPGIRFDYAISAGVRYGDSEGKRELEQLMDDTAEDIAELLESFNVPLLELEASTGSEAADEDDDD